MATTIGARAASTFPAMTGGAGRLLCAYGVINLTANPTIADIHAVCKVPAGATVVDGFLRMEEIDTNASETLDVDVGYAANGDVAADPDAFGNFGTASGGDAVVSYVPEGGTRLPFFGVLKDGVVTFTKDTDIIVTFVAAAATFAAGQITVCVYYVCP